MKRERERKKHLSGTLLRIVAFIALSISIPVLLLSLVFYDYFNKAMIQTISDTIINKLNQSKNTMDSFTGNAKDIIDQIVSDEYVVLFSTEKKENIYAIEKEVQNRITQHKLSNNSIDSIIVYNPENATFITTYGYFRGDEFPDDKLSERFQQFSGESFSLLDVRRLNKYGGENQVGSTNVFSVIYQQFDVDGKLTLAVSVNIDERVIGNTMEELAGAYNADSYVINTEGIIISAFQKDRIFKEFPFKRLWAEKDNSLPIWKTLYKNTLIISLDYEGLWEFVYSADIRDISKYVANIRNGIILVVGGIISLGLLFSLWASKSFYTPIRKLLALANEIRDSDSSTHGFPLQKNEMDGMLTIFHATKEKKTELEARFLKTVPLLRERFFINLINDRLQNRDVFLESLSSLQINLGTPPYRILVVRGHHYDDWFSAQDYKSAMLFNDSLEKMTRGFFDTEHTIYAFEKEANVQVCVLGNQGSDLQSSQMLPEKAEALRIMVAEKLRMSVSIGVSDAFSDIDGFSEAYRQAAEAVAYPLLFDQPGVVRFTDVNLRVETNEQTERLVRKLSVAIKTGNMDTVVNLLDDVFNKMADMTMKAIGHEIDTVILSVINTALELQVDIRHTSVVHETINRMETMARRMEAVRILCADIIRLNHARMGRGMSDLVKNTENFVMHGFMNDISIEEMAQHNGLSPSQFSKLFKDEMEISFVDYLTRIRMKKASDLLLHENVKVKDVYKRVGYSSQQYFTSVFKKHFGMAPAQYARFHRLDSQEE